MKKFNIVYSDINIRELEEEYGFHFNEFEDYTEGDKIKIIVSSLDITHRRIFILYSEFQSLQKVADIYGVSKSTINNKVNVVKNIIKEDINKDLEELLVKYKIKLC